MSIQSELTRLTNAKAAIKTAIEGKGVTVPSGTLLDGMASLIESIEAGGSSVEIPSGYQLSTGTYTPNTEGTNVKHEIKIANSLPYKIPCRMFCLYRDDGFDATGSDSTRYITFYAGSIASLNASAGIVLYRNATSSGCTPAAGTELSNSNAPSYGLPDTNSSNRSGGFVRSIDSKGTLTFSSYGIITLESGKTYKWLAILPAGAEVLS